mgnify:CR=1 FL=1
MAVYIDLNKLKFILVDVYIDGYTHHHNIGNIINMSLLSFQSASELYEELNINKEAVVHGDTVIYSIYSHHHRSSCEAF